MNTLPPATTITCPQCQNRIHAKVEQLMDVASDPSVKQRLLSRNFNIIECPLCSFHGMASVPLIYHDPAKETLLTFTPPELNLTLDQKESMLGGLTRTLLGNIPTQERKAYLLQPQEMLSMDGLINAVLAGEGVTPEMIEKQRAQTQLIQDLATTSKTNLPDLIKENDEQIDAQFFHILDAIKQQYAGQTDSPITQELQHLEQHLLSHSTFGRETSSRLQAFQTAATELESLGENLTRETFVELVADAKDPHHITSLITLARPAADYEFFILLTAKIEDSDTQERQRLEATRSLVLETVQKIDAAAEEQSKIAINLLDKLLHMEDIEAAIKENLSEIDETFLMVLQQRIDSESRNKNPKLTNQLEELQRNIMQAIHDSAPPEIQFINELLSTKTDEDAATLIKQRLPEITDKTLAAIHRAIEQFRQRGQTDVANKLESLHTLAEKERTDANIT